MKPLLISLIFISFLSATAFPQTLDDMISQNKGGMKTFIQKDCVDRAKVHADVYAAFQINPILNNKEFLFALIDKVMEQDHLQFCDQVINKPVNSKDSG